MERARRSLVKQTDPVQDASSEHNARLSNFGKRYYSCEINNDRLSDIPWNPC